MPPPAYVPPETTPCPVCGRPFVADRLETHERICRKLVKRKPRVHDSQKQRLAGTEHAALYRRAQHRPAPKVPENRWRERHEDLVTSLRAARAAQRHLAAGGRPQDLPPPPPSDYSDYVQCPSCGRKFNQTAAERHIPRCADYEFNKPGPSRPARRTPVVSAPGTSPPRYRPLRRIKGRPPPARKTGKKG